jgi:hypothetical protein
MVLEEMSPGALKTGLIQIVGIQVTELSEDGGGQHKSNSRFC